ncbi:MAG: NAD(P)H-binding protein [Deltaproteobacteria bacterium]|nr:NAD(P)H-binding protein [Deltaproteobacteria bacterium]
MKLTIFGATGTVGRECVEQSLEAGHDVTVLVRTPAKLSENVRSRVQVVEGDGLDGAAVARAIPAGTAAVLFAVGVGKSSPEDLCTDVTRHILAAMPGAGARRLVWVGGGSTPVARDDVTFGARFVEFFADTFMGLRHRDKEHQLELLEANRQVEWIGLRPLVIRGGPRREVYRVGYDRYNMLSTISAADIAHAMLAMLENDSWLHEAPIIQY